MKTGDNIDDVRAAIMRLENADEFGERAWLVVLAILERQGRVAALADARRRMETARMNYALAQPQGEAAEEEK